MICDQRLRQPTEYSLSSHGESLLGVRKVNHDAPSSSVPTTQSAASRTMTRNPAGSARQ
jgi:hypothetical protein